MLFRSVRFFSRRSSKNSALIGALGCGLIAAVGLAPSSAMATLTAFPSHPNNTSSDPKTGLSNLLGTQVYWPAQGGTFSNGGFLDIYNGELNVPYNAFSLTYDSYSKAGSPNSNEAMIFTIQSASTTTPPANGNLYLVALSGGNQSQKIVPIAFYRSDLNTTGLSSCVDSLNNAIGPCVPSSTNNVVMQGSNRFVYGVPYTLNSTVQIGIYPLDVCKGYNGGNSGLANGCVTNAQVQNPTGSASPMTISFALVSVPNGTNLTTNVLPEQFPSATGNVTAGTITYVDTSSSLNQYFQTEPSTFNCFSTSTQDQVYFPGDKEIHVYPAVFTLSAATGQSPASNVIVVANGSSTPSSATVTTGSGYMTGQSVMTRVSYSSDPSSWTAVTGFENSTDQSSVYYTVGFMMRDGAGFVAGGPNNPSVGSQCVLQNVRTSEILGLLNKSNCFIATAAFRSIDSAPVAMLREFRDQILLKNSLGRSFVRTYYHYSPPAAEWLMQNPVFRFPVLLLLAPVQALAWMSLRPLAFATLLLVSMMLLVTGVAISRVVRKGEPG